jgi:hypothetical protein
MQTHLISYDYIELARVVIDEEKAAPFIKEMVEFWANYGERLTAAKGSYTKAWLMMLGRFILRNSKPPKDEEGWYPLDGSYGIKLEKWDTWEPDPDEIEVETVCA